MAQPVSTDRVATDHRRGPVAWREVGRGEPLVFLHGLGGTRTAWEPQLRGLGDRFRCIAWDMPGYGDAEPITPLTYSAIARRLVDLLDALGLETATLVGLSFGGMHALHTALEHPDRVSRLVIADSSPRFGIDGTSSEDWTSARLEPLERGETPTDIAERVVDAITAVPLTGRIRGETIASFSRISSAGFRAAVQCLPTNDIVDRLSEIPHPTLVIVGELDQETPVGYSQMLVEGVPRSELRVIPGVGHLTPAEAPDSFNTLTAAFVAATPDPSGDPIGPEVPDLPATSKEDGP